MKTNFFITAAASASALGAVLLIGVLGASSTSTEKGADPISSREVLSYNEDLVRDTGVITYEYKGEALPEKLAPDEVVALRTEDSYTRQLAIENPGTKEERRTYESIFYTRPTFIKQGSTWYYREHATTTEAAFLEAERSNPIASFFWEEVRAASASPFSEAGDGYIAGTDTIISTCTGADAFATARANASGSAFPVATTGSIGGNTSEADELGSDGIPDLCDASISRGFLPFSTGVIPNGASISAASLNVYFTASQDGDNDGLDYATVVETTQATHTTLASTDYNDVGTTEGIDAGERKDITSVTTGTYTVFTLNATGRGWIKTSGQASVCSGSAGISCFGLREGHDLANSAYVPNVGGTTLTFSTSEDGGSGTAQDPFLSVTYTGGGAAFAFWQFQDF